MGAAVIDDNVSYGFQLMVPQLIQQLTQLPFATISAAETVQIPGQVTLGAHSVTGGREPYAGEASSGNHACLLLKLLQGREICSGLCFSM